MGARVFVKGRPCGWCVWGPGISSFVQNAGCHVPGQDRKEPSLSWHCQRSRFCVPWSKMIITGKMLLSTLFSASESWRNHIFFYSILTCYTREPKYHWMPLTVKTSVHLTGQNSPLFRWESWGRREAFGQRPFNRNRSRTYQSWHLWPPRFSSPIPTSGHPRLKGFTGDSTLNTGLLQGLLLWGHQIWSKEWVFRKKLSLQGKPTWEAFWAPNFHALLLVLLILCPPTPQASYLGSETGVDRRFRSWWLEVRAITGKMKTADSREAAGRCGGGGPERRQVRMERLQKREHPEGISAAASD